MFEQTLAADDEPAASSSSTTLARGTALGRYIVLEELARGGMGVVYAAYDPELDRRVALKLVHDDGETTATRGTARLLREAQALAKLAHPNTIAIHDVGTLDDRVWLAMELVSGRTLGAWSRESRRAWSDVLDKLCSAGEGLAAAHAAGLVHRDVKPENVMIGDDNRVRIMDFGLARATSTTAESSLVDSAHDRESAPPHRRAALLDDVTRAGARPGTPAYMAPEQIAENQTDARSDQFSFCVTLWEALYGERPFAGATLAELTAAICGGRLRSPPRDARVPVWLRRILRRGLEVQPARRWPSMQALLAALARGRVRARRRRQALVLGGIIGVAAAFVGVRELERRREVAACEAEGGSIDEVWNDDVRANLQAAIVATGTAHAEVTAQKVVPLADAYAEGWRTAATEACLDAHVRRTWDDAQLDRARWCLDLRRVELERTVSRHARADTRSVAHVVEAFARLRDVTPCRDELSLQRLPTPSSDVREQVDHVRAELADALGQQRAGDYDQALPLAQAALVRAESLQWRPVIASARLRLGSILDAKGEFAEAERVLESAYFEAAEAGALDVAVDSADTLVFMLGHRLGREPEAIAWSRHHAVMLTLLPDPNGLRTAQRLNNLGVVLMSMGEYDEALENHARVLAIREEALGPDHIDVALTLNNLGIVYSSIGESAQARELHTRALTIRERQLGPQHPYVAMSLHNLAVAHQSEGLSDRADELLARALAIREAALGTDHPDVASTLNNIAVIQQERGRLAEASATYARALRIFESRFGPDHMDVGMILNNLGDIDLATGAFEDARTKYERTVEIMQKAHGAEHVVIAHPVLGLAEVALAQGRFADALPQARRALRLREATKVPPGELARAQFAVARSLDGLDRDPQEALALASSAREGFRAAGEPDAEHLREVEEWIARHAR